MAKATGNIPEGQGFWDAYEDIRGGIDADRKAYAERNPTTALAAEVIPAAVTGGGLLVKGTQKLADNVVDKVYKAGSNVANRAMAGAVVGGVEGAAVGAGNADPGERLTGAGIGFGVGVPLGGLGGAAVGRLEDAAKLKQDRIGRINAGSGDRDLAPYRVVGATSEAVPGPVQPRVTIDPDRGTISLPSPENGSQGAAQRLIGGKLKSDPAAEKLLKHGIDERFVSQIKSASKDDQRRMLDMVRIAKSGWVNNRNAVAKRPGERIGDVISGRVNWLLNKRKEAGGQIDRVASKLRGKPVNYVPAVQRLIDSLEGQGIRFTPDGQFRINPKIQGSDYEDLASVAKELNVIFRRLTDEPLDAEQVHQIKRFLDTRLSYEGKQQGGLQGRLAAQLKALRHDLDGALDEAFPEYAKVNEQYSDMTGTLEALQDAFGSKVDLLSPAATGIGSRKITSNYISGQNMATAMDQAERMVQKYSGQRLNNNMHDLVSMETLLRNIVPQNNMNTFQGDVTKGVNAGIRASMGGMGPTEAATGVAGHIMEKLTKKDPGQILDDLEELLKQQVAR